MHAANKWASKHMKQKQTKLNSEKDKLTMIFAYCNKLLSVIIIKFDQKYVRRQV